MCTSLLRSDLNCVFHAIFRAIVFEEHLLPADRRYKCIRCASRFCSKKCLGVHTETRCLKFLA